jgi:hypothetical protein
MYRAGELHEQSRRNKGGTIKSLYAKRSIDTVPDVYREIRQQVAKKSNRTRRNTRK